MTVVKGKDVDSKPLIKSENPFPVVGIGASAGGLDAFRKLLEAIPENSGMAYVLVQHLDPNHESILAELLQKTTRLPVLEITDDIQVEPDHVYIIPSNKMLIANDGVLKLSPRPLKNKKDRNLPIDLFFISLAEIHQQHAIGVVLSGTASDGTAGLKAIKEQGGLTFAQDEASAAYFGMPNSAAKAGVVDFVLPPEKIPAKILAILQEKILIDKAKNDPALQKQEATKQILSQLRIRKGTDFSNYKQTTVGRRILRRMKMSRNASLSSYVKYLTENNKELDTLYQDMLIPVTSFFRDEKTFAYLCEHVIPFILKDKTTNESIRIWVAGCSTGEEAYSLAMCFLECIDANTKLQLFATDLSEPAIAKARSGNYSKKEVSGVSSSRLKMYFTKTNDSYTVDKLLRDVCVFARHDFLKDPPFIKMDFISCRNVLIYMESILQKKALTTFHYALNERGFLLLGKTETTKGVEGLFKLQKKNEKIFTRNEVSIKYKHTASPRLQTESESSTADFTTKPAFNDFRKTADDIIISQASPGVIVNEAMDIVQFRGSTSAYLEQSSGTPSHNLLKQARQGLGFELRALLHKAKKIKSQVLKENIHFEDNGAINNVSIEVIPLPNTVEPYYMILFHKGQSMVKKIEVKGKKTSKSMNVKNILDERSIRIAQLENELEQTHDNMRVITNDQEAINEELQSDNEELLSSSEELQSLNEELETSKEELQSSNEELVVVNQEMVSLNEQLKGSRDYAEAIVATTRDSLLILDRYLRVKTANRSFYQTFAMSQHETEGALIYNLGDKQWDIPALRLLLDKIVVTGETFYDFEVTHTFKTIFHRTLLLNAREMKGEGKDEKLILLAIEDITEKANKVTEQLIARNKLDELQMRHSMELEGKIQQRTIELSGANDLLEQKNQELSIMNKELDSFTFISSHDLQEPLRKIQTYANRILTTESLSDQGKENFKRIQSAALRMRRLIDDLLTFSRLSSHEIKFENIDITDIVKDVIEDLKEVIAEKKAVIETTELCEAYIIPFQFHQLLFNLISNALKFSNPGIPPHIILKSVNISYSKENEANLIIGKEYCHITVSDNGIGFEPHFSKRIFEVFQRLHGKSEYEGTGIGLAIVKKIVENHKGIIIATSQLSEGATFDIYIPAHSKR